MSANPDLNRLISVREIRLVARLVKIEAQAVDEYSDNEKRSAAAAVNLLLYKLGIPD